MSSGFLQNSTIRRRRRGASRSFRRRLRSCTGSGSNSTSRSKEGSGYSTQKRCLKPPAASNPLRNGGPLPYWGAMSWVGYKVHLTESCDGEALPNLITSVRSTAATARTQTSFVPFRRGSREAGFCRPSGWRTPPTSVQATWSPATPARATSSVHPTGTTPGRRRPKKALTWPLYGYSGLESGDHHAPAREYFGLHVRESPEPDGTSSERGTTVSSAILLHWSRVLDPLGEYRS